LNHVARRGELIVGIVPGFTIGNHSPALARLPRSAAEGPAAGERRDWQTGLGGVFAGERAGKSLIA
jgi:hypothetical protein